MSIYFEIFFFKFSQRQSSAGLQKPVDTFPLTTNSQKNKPYRITPMRLVSNRWLKYWYIFYPNICFKSSSGVLIGLISKVSTRNCNTFGLKKAGKVGPR